LTLNLYLDQKSVILVFSRSAKAESKVKILHSNAAQNLLLHQALYNNTMEAVKATQLPTIVLDETLQHGDNFGEKYCNALEYCFSKGFEKVISVGTDCATLTKNILLNAHKSSGGKNLIGADENGGFYLFTLQKKNYLRKNFLSFSWCTARILNELICYFKDNHSIKISFIQHSNDLNSIADLLKQINAKKASAFLKLLFVLFNKLSNVFTYTLVKVENLVIDAFSLRGPPSLITTIL